MFKFLPLKEEIFGLDINDLSLKIVRLKKKRKGFVLTSLNEAGIALGVIEGGMVKDEDALAKVIKSALSLPKGKKIKTKYIAASLPDEKSFLQVIQLPRMDKAELNLAVPLEAENYIPLPINDVYLDFEVISPIKDYLNHMEVLIAAIPQKIADSYISCFKKAGLVPAVLELRSQSITRALIRKETNSSPLILIDLGENIADFIVFSGSSIRFACSIPASSGDSLEDLACQIKKYINFYRDHSSYEYLLSGEKKEKILVCGERAEINGLAEILTKKTGIEAQIGNPLTNLVQKKQKITANKSMASFAAAIGLAMRASDEN